MLTNYAQINSFDQFLFSHFSIKDTLEPVSKRVKKAVAKKQKTKSAIKSELEGAQEMPQIEALSQKKEEAVAKADTSVKADFKNLAEVIDSIPDKVRMMNIEELAHKHEAEWYHAFRDLKEEISKDISTRQAGHVGVLKMKSEIKEFTELLDEHIEKAMLEIERIFQAFPSLSRVALIYLLSIIIAIPLMFFTMNTDRAAQSAALKNIHLGKANATEITQQMKSDYIAKNSAKILASGQTSFRVRDLPHRGMVAGAYEEKSVAEKTSKAGEKIAYWYRYINDLKDELNNLFSK